MLDQGTELFLIRVLSPICLFPSIWQILGDKSDHYNCSIWLNVVCAKLLQLTINVRSAMQDSEYNLFGHIYLFS